MIIAKQTKEKLLKEKKEIQEKLVKEKHTELSVVVLSEYKQVEKYINKNKVNVVIHTAVKDDNQILENILRMFISIYKNINSNLPKILKSLVDNNVIFKTSDFF